MRSRTWPIFVAGFGCLLALIGILGWEIKRRTEEIQREISTMHEALRSREQALNELQSAIFLCTRFPHGPAIFPPFPAGDHLRDMRELSSQALSSIRNLATGLRPSVLDDLGLDPALRWQAREFSRRYPIPVTVEIDASLEPLPESHRTCIYRVAQESLTNIARHAEARNIHMTLHGDRQLLSLAVQDDGIGFDLGKTDSNGLGLVGIEERVRKLGGGVSIITQPSKGTLLQVQIPRPQAVQS